MTLTPDERHAVAGELRWLARRREQNAVMSADWLRQRADWIEVSGERRAPARGPSNIPDWIVTVDENGHPTKATRVPDSVLRWGEPGV